MDKWSHNEGRFALDTACDVSLTNTRHTMYIHSVDDTSSPGNLVVRIYGNSKRCQDAASTAPTVSMWVTSASYAGPGTSGSGGSIPYTMYVDQDVAPNNYVYGGDPNNWYTISIPKSGSPYGLYTVSLGYFVRSFGNPVSWAEASEPAANWNSGTVNLTFSYDGPPPDPDPITTYWNYKHDVLQMRRYGIGTFTNAGGLSFNAGDNIQVRSQVSNIGTGTGAAFTHSVDYKVGSAIWAWDSAAFTNPNGRSKAQTAMPQGNNQVLWWNPPAQYPTYQVPNVADGTQICFRAVINPFGGYTTPTFTTTAPGNLYSSTLCFTVNNPVNATCSFINTPTSAVRTQAFNVQVRVNNLTTSSSDISGSANPVTVVRTSGATVSAGLPNTNSTYAATSPGSNRDLTAISVTASTNGSLVLTATVANTGNSNNTCTATITIADQRNATCAFINTPASATVGVGFTVQVRVNNLDTSTASISGANQPVTLSSSGVTVTGLNTPKNAYSTLNPNNSTDLPADTVLSALTPGTVTITATVTNVDNTNNTCQRTITIRYAPPAVTCQIASPDPIETGTPDVTVTITVWYTSPTPAGSGVANQDGQVTVVTLGATPAATASVSGPVTPPSPALPASIVRSSAAGVTFTYHITFNEGTTYILDGFAKVETDDGVGGTVEGSDDCAGEAPVGDFPYLREYGGEVWAGGQFADGLTCSGTPGTGAIYAFSNGSTGSPIASSTAPAWSGAGSQLNITALMNINGYVSASVRNGTPNMAPRGLTFANQGSGDTTYGGGFGGTGQCITDYFNSTKYTATADGVTVSSGTSMGDVDLSANGRRQYHLSGSTAIPPSNPSATGLTIGTDPPGTRTVTAQVAVYVTGNVFIGDNIEYGSYTDRENMPFFALIVCGNIYIDGNVRRLDGLYVAQPGRIVDGRCVNDASVPTNSGTIYTCAVYSVLNRCTGVSLISDGDTPLAINGSLVANRIKWMRTTCSLRYAQTREVPDFDTGAASTSCGNTSSHAAETVNYSAQMWLANTPLKAPNRNPNTTTSGYQSIRYLPPIYNTALIPVSPPEPEPPVPPDGDGSVACMSGGVAMAGRCYELDPYYGFSDCEYVEAMGFQWTMVYGVTGCYYVY